jgi:VIT1/CCC1 family predicted Fe2+/Mn2+ transporter
MNTTNNSKSKFQFRYLKEFVYGGIDGCVTTFAVVAGSTGAGLTPSLIIVLGFANLIADGFSMSVGNYLSVKSELDSQKSEVPVQHRSTPLQTARATFLSFVCMGMVPLVVYILNYFGIITSMFLFPLSAGLTFFAFLFIGFLRGYLTGSSMVRGIWETLILGVIAASLAYFVGNTLEKLLD